MADPAVAQDDDTTTSSGEVDPQDVQDAQQDAAQTSTTDRGRSTAERLLSEGEGLASGKDPAQASLIAQYGLNAQQARAILQRARDTLAQNAPQMINLAAAQRMSNPGGWGQLYAGSMGAAAGAQEDINKQLAGYDLDMTQANKGSLDAQLKMLTNRMGFYDKVAPAAMRVEGLPGQPAAKGANDPVHTILAGMGVTDFENDPRVAPAYKAYLEHLTHVPDQNGQQKPPVGYKWAADPDNAGQQMLVPITGGPKDPNAPAAAGSREAVIQNRVINALNLGTAALHNVVQMPMGADTGLLGGYGAHPGTSAMDTMAASLKNKLSDEDVQQYNLVVSGLSRNLAGIETAGLMPPGTFTDSLNSVQARPGDTQAVRLQKLAESRQIIETGLQSLLDSPRVTQGQKDKIQSRIDDLKKDIPYSVEDTIALSRQPGTTTMAKLMQQKGLAGKEGGAAGGAPPANLLKDGIHTTFKNGQTWTLINGQPQQVKQ